MQRLNSQKNFRKKRFVFTPAKTTRAAIQLYLLGIKQRYDGQLCHHYLSTKSKKQRKSFIVSSSCHSSNLNLYLKVKHVCFPLVSLTIYLLMIIISHFELDSHMSCNKLRVRVYTGTLYYGNVEVAILFTSCVLGLLVISSFLQKG